MGKGTKKYYPTEVDPDWELPKGVNPLTTIQPQVAQLELNFNGPLIKDAVVEKLTDLPLLKSRWNYQHKRVWVKEYSAEYYIADGDGTDLLNWKRSIGRMVVNKWDSSEYYQLGDVVSIGGKLYYAIQNVGPGISPLSNEDYWQIVSGEIETYRYLFTNTNSVLIYTEVRNPIFEIILGDIVYDEDDNIVLNEETGLAELSNKEIIEACVVQREDLLIIDGTNTPNNLGGIPYEVSFYADEKLVEKSGCINIK